MAFAPLDYLVPIEERDWKMLKDLRLNRIAVMIVNGRRQDQV